MLATRMQTIKNNIAASMPFHRPFQKNKMHTKLRAPKTKQRNNVTTQRRYEIQSTIPNNHVHLANECPNHINIYTQYPACLNTIKQINFHLFLFLALQRTRCTNHISSISEIRARNERPPAVLEKYTEVLRSNNFNEMFYFCHPAKTRLKKCHVTL